MEIVRLSLSKPLHHPSSRLRRDQGDSMILMSNWYSLLHFFKKKILVCYITYY